MNGLMLHHPAVIIVLVALLIAAWVVIISSLPLSEDEIEDLSPWPPRYSGPPSSVRVIRSASDVFDWMQDVGIEPDEPEPTF